MAGKKNDEIMLPFGKHKGRTLREVMQEEPSYLAGSTTPSRTSGESRRRWKPCPTFRRGWRRTGNDGRSSSTLEETIEDVVTTMFRVEPTQAEWIASATSCSTRLANRGPDFMICVVMLAS